MSEDIRLALESAEQALDACHKFHGDDCLLPTCACEALPKVRRALAVLSVGESSDEEPAS